MLKNETHQSLYNLKYVSLNITTKLLETNRFNHVNPETSRYP